MTILPTSSDMYSRDVSSPEVEIIIDSDEDVLFQMDDITSCSSIVCKEGNEAKPIDMQVRYYKPTSEPPTGLSSSVVTNDTDYLRRNIMKIRMKSIKETEDAQSLEEILEEEIDNRSYNSDEDSETVLYSTDNNRECDYEDYTSMISNRHNHENSFLYSRSAPSAFSRLSALPSSTNNLSPPSSPLPSKVDNNKFNDEPQQNVSDILNQELEECNDKDSLVKKEEIDTTEEKNNDIGSHKTTPTLAVLIPNRSPPATNTDLHLINDEPKNTNSWLTDQADESYIITKQDTWNYYSNIAINNNISYYYPILQYHNNLLKRSVIYDTNSPSFRSWSRSASKRYKEDSRVSLQCQQRMYEMYSNNYNRILWEQLHIDNNALKKMATNPFIIQSITENACSIKVTGLSGRSRFKDIQRHFFSPHVVCAYIMYRNYDEMVRAIILFDKTKICGDVIYCRPSFYGELQRDDAKQTRILYNEWKRGVRSHMPQRGRDVVIPEHLEKATSIKNQTPTKTQHKYVLNQVIPEIQRDTFIPVQYVIVKPWLRLDVECSQDIEYWSFNSIHMSFLNHLYNTTPTVILLFCVRGTRSYQGYAVM
ncbi:unnamed protein product [Mucor hiemalis]